ncbi:hypothetical protein [Actinacidiphila bryophytorum]|uniref:hypothetical protein n=1 Tax=Actinacidiphila bryophytorum TaxID=1436133 RepID=UPI002176AAF8|nr:hypothetical protein [Actinacidiphila bryophytorum]UWE13278.1 hypothetical protein NYE86_34485 [Actinacidiphila bryophytorum]
MTQQDRALRWALRFLPADYRAEHGAELAAIHDQATRGAGRAGRLREALDIAAFGLRRRTGLGSDRAAGRIMAQAAPLAVALALGGSVVNLLSLFAPDVRHLPADSLPNVWVLADQFAAPLLWSAVLAAVWTGRWSAARAMVVPATLLRLCDVPLLALSHSGVHGYRTGMVLNVVVPLLTAAVVLAAPRDLLGSSAAQRTALAAATALALVVWGAQFTSSFHYVPPGGPRITHTLWAGVLAVALLCAGRGRPVAAGLAVAVLPLAVQSTVPLLYPLSPAGEGALIAVLAAAAAQLLRTRRRTA